MEAQELAPVQARELVLVQVSVLELVPGVVQAQGLIL